MARDYYQLLEISRKAGKEEIRKAFRLKAKEIHPDRNPDDPGANAKFITLKKAHDLLVDPVRRQKYDRALLRSNSNRSRRSSRGTGTTGRAGAKRRNRNEPRAAPKSRRGLDIESTVRLSLEQVWKGSTRTVHGHTIHIRGIPADNRIRYPGKGGAGENGGPKGDLHVVVEVLPHKRYIRDGDDLQCDLTLNPEFAQRGGAKVVDTLSGKVRLTIEPGTETGQDYRIRGKGLPRYGTDNRYGDLYVRITVKKPLAIRGNNIKEKLLISLKEAWSGGTYTTSVNKSVITLAIPRGSQSYQRIHIAGAGQPGKHGGPPGDLYVTLEVLPDEQFRRDGDDLHLIKKVAIDLHTALQGGEAEVSTFSGSVQLRIPPGTGNGDRLSLSGHGMPRKDDPRKCGDLNVRVQVTTPPGEQWHRSSSIPGSVRDTWYWPDLPRQISEPDALYMKIQYKEDSRFGYYDWAVLVNNSDMEYRGRKRQFSGQCYPSKDDDQAKLDAAARARDEATAALLLRTRIERIPHHDVGEIPF